MAQEDGEREKVDGKELERSVVFNGQACRRKNYQSVIPVREEAEGVYPEWQDLIGGRSISDRVHVDANGILLQRKPEGYGFIPSMIIIPLS